jgi:anti-anti-sigma factor
MTIELNRATETSNAVEIRVTGRFDFSMHRRFREVWSEAGHAPTCVVNLRDTSYVDSSALGMLLLLREDYGKVMIKDCPDSVRKVFSIARFDSLFEFC